MLTIGQLARTAGVHVETIRYYERRGLVPSPRRTRSGYRQYTDEAVARVRFIRRSKELGFSLKEIRELLGLRARHAAACEAVEGRARQKVAVVERKIEELERLRDTLARLADSCARREPTAECPILESLEEQGDPMGVGGEDRR